MTALRPRATALRDEGGFTIIEVMVAALLIVTAVLALLGAFDAMAKGALTAQRHQQALAYGQRQLERLRTFDYNTQLGLNAMPVASATDGNPISAPSNAPADPNYYVTGSGSTTALKIMARYTDKTSGLQAGVSPNPEPIDGPGDAKLTDPQVSPGPQAFSSNGLTGKIYRYVTWRSEHCPAATTSGIVNPCPGTQDSKRITIAVVPDRLGNGAGPSKPIWLSTVVSDPNATPTGVAPPKPVVSTGATAQTFFLYDTPCSSTLRQTIAAAHRTHNTSPTPALPAPLTTCTGTSGMPDLMGKDVTPGADTATFFDYSNEITRPLMAGFSGQAGLALRRTSTDCPTSYAANQADSLAYTVHSWATAPMPATGFLIPGGGRAALSFWTQTLDGAPAQATLCATLRDSATGLELAKGRYTPDTWPVTPTQVSFAWDFPATPTTVAAGSRLVLTLSLHSSSTRDIVLLYDHPSYQSALFVTTTTPLT